MSSAPDDGPASAEELDRQRAAQKRAMSITRMLDYGMDHWDATKLTGAPAADPWHDAAARLADAQVERAEQAAALGNLETAVACYRRATAALVFAQMAFNSDTATKRSLYVRMSSTYQAAADIDCSLAVARLSVPWRSGHCNAWLVRPRGSHSGATVIIVGGQSGWGPAYHVQAEALARRGLSTVLLEAPGQGESRLVGGWALEGDVHKAFSATVDAVRTHTGSEGPWGVWGNSLGGLFAARAAVHDARFIACCINGAPADPEPPPFRTALEQSMALLGANTTDEVAAAFRGLWLDPAVDRMGASLLVLHGGADPLIALHQQEKFLPMSPRPTLRVWDDGEHTMYNHASERTELVSDWFREQLVRGV